MKRTILAAAATTAIMAAGMTVQAASIIDLSGGDYHSMALISDGSVMVCGGNMYGQLGDGTFTNRAYWAPVPGLSNAIAATCGFESTYIAHGNGTVSSCGLNDAGQLGDGTTNEMSPSLTSVQGLSNVVDVAAGIYTALARKTDGTVWGWGYNESGLLGNGGFDNTNRPVQMAGVTNAAGMAAGYLHSLVRTEDGRVLGCGANIFGELGGGVGIVTNFPTPIAGISNVTQVTAGFLFSAAVRDDGTLWTWGLNVYGQLGHGTTNMATSAPTQVHGLSNVVSMAWGVYFMSALQADGTVWAWGDNSYGQLGITGFDSTNRPVQIPGLSNVVAIGAGVFQMLALDSAGRLWAWGDDCVGQLGRGFQNSYRDTPTQIASLAGAASVKGGWAFSAALLRDGTLRAWGANYYGQLGNGSTSNTNLPTPVAGLSDVTDFDLGYYHAAALRSDGSMWTWGDNGHGQIGDGTDLDRVLPVQLSTVSNVSRIATGRDHTLAAQGANQQLFAWGRNGDGQLGIGTDVSTNIPVMVNDQTNVACVAGGSWHSVVCDTNGQVWTWGYNSSGQLGLGHNDSTNIPMLVPGLSNIIATAAGYSFSMALAADGSMWTWGANYNGQLGIGNNFSTNTPQRVQGLNNVTAIAAGSYHALAIKGDGTVWAWGYNSDGQLGNGSLADTNLPVQVQGIDNVTAIGAGSYHSLAVKSDGTVWAWGDNFSGQLGLGLYNFETSPVLSGVLLAPESLVASDGAFLDFVRLEWTPSVFASEYEIWRCASNDSASAVLVGVTNALTYDDADILPRWTYYYWIKASWVMGRSALSAPDSGYARAHPINDYTGNGVSDLAVFNRDNGMWYILGIDGTLIAWDFNWGPVGGAWPVSGDYDGDGRADPAVFDEATGLWYVAALTSVQSSVSGIQTTKSPNTDNRKPNTTPPAPGILNTEHCTLNTDSARVIVWALPWGWPGAWMTPGDYDGDGMSDFGVFNPDNGRWYIAALSSKFKVQGSQLENETPNTGALRVIAWAFQWGWSGAWPVSGDYDGDGRDDFAVFDRNTGFWYVMNADGTVLAWALAWGRSDMLPVQGDYDGDGISDLALFDQAAGRWYVLTLDGRLLAWEFIGRPGTTPVPGDYDGDGVSDLAMFDQGTGAWYVLTLDGRLLAWDLAWGWPGAIPVGTF